MNPKKIAAIAAGAALLSILAAAPVGAQTTTSTVSGSFNGSLHGMRLRGHHLHLRGTVTAISGNTITLTRGNKTWTVVVDSSTQIRSSDVKISLDKVKVGDKIMVVSKLTINKENDKKDVDAKIFEDLSAKIHRASLKGVISNLNADAKSFTLTLANGKTVNVSLGSDAKFRLNGTDASANTFANLSNGLKIGVSGVLDKNTESLNGTVVSNAQIRAGGSNATINTNGSTNTSGGSTSGDVNANLNGVLHY
jgi:hypothetical protein